MLLVLVMFVLGVSTVFNGLSWVWCWQGEQGVRGPPGPPGPAPHMKEKGAEIIRGEKVRP